MLKILSYEAAYHTIKEYFDVPFAPSYTKTVQKRFQRSLSPAKTKQDLQQLIQQRKKELELISKPLQTKRAVTLQSQIDLATLKIEVEKRRQDLEDLTYQEQALAVGSIRSLHDYFFGQGRK